MGLHILVSFCNNNFVKGKQGREKGRKEERERKGKALFSSTRVLFLQTSIQEKVKTGDEAKIYT